MKVAVRLRALPVLRVAVTLLVALTSLTVLSSESLAAGSLSYTIEVSTDNPGALVLSIHNATQEEVDDLSEKMGRPPDDGYKNDDGTQTACWTSKNGREWAAFEKWVVDNGAVTTHSMTSPTVDVSRSVP